MATITVKELATELSTDARTTRKFLRSITEKDDQPGKGARWSIEKKEIRSLRKKFAAFEANMRKKDAAPVEEAEIEEIDQEIDAPTDEELLAIEAE